MLNSSRSHYRYLAQIKKLEVSGVTGRSPIEFHKSHFSCCADAVDAAAICEAVTRPTMRFVEVKTPEQQAILAVHRTRDSIVRQRTQTINMLRAQLAEFGIVLPQGVYHALRFSKDCVAGDQPNLPKDAEEVIFDLCDQLLFLHAKILRHSRHMTQIAKTEKRVALLRTIPGVGPITASAIVATVGSGKQFNSGREFAAWLGLTPLNGSSGGKERLGHISKMGDQYIRRLLVLGMTFRIRPLVCGHPFSQAQQSGCGRNGQQNSPHDLGDTHPK